METTVERVGHRDAVSVPAQAVEIIRSWAWPDIDEGGRECFRTATVMPAIVEGRLTAAERRKVVGLIAKAVGLVVDALTRA
jgi:hypothetical protein